MNQIFSDIGSAVAIASLVIFGFQVLFMKIPPPNVASFLMWTILDIVLVMTAISANNPIGLPLGWTLGAGFVTTVSIIRGSWRWTWQETLSAIGATIATITWKVTVDENPTIGVVSAVLAMNIAGIPILYAMVKNPARSTWWMWASTAVACVFTTIGLGTWTFTSLLLPLSSFLFNGSMTLLVLRGK